MHSTEFTAEDLKNAKAMAHEMIEDLCRKNIPWQLAANCNVLVVDLLIQEYQPHTDQYKFEFWSVVKSELSRQVLK